MYTKRSFTFFYVRLTFPLPEILKPIGKTERLASNQRVSYPQTRVVRYGRVPTSTERTLGLRCRHPLTAGLGRAHGWLSLYSE